MNRWLIEAFAARSFSPKVSMSVTNWAALAVVSGLVDGVWGMTILKHGLYWAY
jgi:hypothetical protein